MEDGYKDKFARFNLIYQIPFLFENGFSIYLVWSAHFIKLGVKEWLLRYLFRNHNQQIIHKFIFCI